LRWRRPAALLTLVAAAVVVAVVAGALPLLQGQPQPGQATPTPSRSASSRTPSPGLSSQPVVIGSDGGAVLEDGPSITWTTIALSQFGSNMVGAVGAARVGGTMVVAANDTFMSDTKPVVIESTDGTRWSRVPTDGPEFAHALLDSLVAIPGGLLLVGESLDPDPLCADGAAGCMPVRATLMWRSSDGQTWQLLPTRTTAPFDRVWIASIAAGPKGLVAFGLHYPVVGSPENVVFHSPDGTSWSSAAFPYQSSESPVVLVQQVIATSAGFVAVSGGGADEATAWYSADGLSWKRASTPGGSTDPAMQAAAGSDGMVAYSDKLWVSADGRTWHIADTPPYFYGSSWIAGDGTQIMVISGQSVYQYVYWSQDGKTWHRGDSTPALPGVSIGAGGSAWILGSTVIAVGQEQERASPQNLYVGRIEGH